MIQYNTVAGSGKAECTVEHSRFIGRALPVQHREEADAFITDIRKEFRDATHHVPVIVLGDQFQVQWASDDGEPQGTSGAPILQMLVRKKITNVVMVITRYFGGIKLGTGGLMRAYTGCARATLEAAGIRKVQERFFLSVKLPYSVLGQIQSMAREGWFRIEQIQYEDLVMMELSCASSDMIKLCGLVSDLCGGTEKIISKVKKNS